MLTLLAAISTAEAAPTTYDLSGTLLVTVYKDPDTLASDLSHDHAVRAGNWSGTATWDPEDPGACAMDIKVPVSGLVVDDPAMRKKAGLEGTLDDGMRSDIKENMLSDEQLDGGKYTQITWKASSCEVKGDKVSMTGEMTIHGTTKKLTVPLVVSGDGAAFKAQGKTTLKATDYGFEPFSAMFGQLKNKMWHLNDTDYAHRLQKNISYSRLEAERLLSRGKKIRWYHMITWPLIRSILSYTFHRGYKDGMAGVIWTLYIFGGTLSWYVMAWERQNPISRQDIEAELASMWEKQKDKILKSP